MESVGIPAINATTTSCAGQSSTTLYSQLILPLAPFVFKTMIWYQGEANVGCNSDNIPWQHGYYCACVRALACSAPPPLNVHVPLCVHVRIDACMHACVRACVTWCVVPSTTPLSAPVLSARLLPELITSWRALFQVEFAALIEQLAAYGSTDIDPTNRDSDPWPVLQVGFHGWGGGEVADRSAKSASPRTCAAVCGRGCGNFCEVVRDVPLIYK
jgi:hypothetical protein